MAGSVKHRVRIRRLEDVPRAELPSFVQSNYWALSRPHVAEELERLDVRIREAHRHDGIPLRSFPREIHMHPVRHLGLSGKGSSVCDGDCLIVEAVPASEPKSADELDREKVASA